MVTKLKIILDTAHVTAGTPTPVLLLSLLEPLHQNVNAH